MVAPQGLCGPSLSPGASWCFLVPPGALWCLLVPPGASWCPLVLSVGGWAPASLLRLVAASYRRGSSSDALDPQFPGNFP